MSVFGYPAKVEARSRNRLLAQIAQADYEMLRPHLKPVPLPEQFVLYTPRRTIEFVYFLESGIASLVVTMQNGKTAEVGTIGNEGFVGLPFVFGDDAPQIGVFMQVPGAGLRMPAAVLRQQFDHSATLRGVLLHYAGAFFNQVAQSAACAYLHPLEQRCCRWLLATSDRMPSDQFALTQEFLAMMLGVRRSSVSAVMGELQRRGVVRYSRGRVSILDRKALQAGACECYRLTKAEFDRALG
jgi:CRP-like cAMP-binding protein